MRILTTLLVTATLAYAQGNTPANQLATHVVDLTYPVGERFPNWEGTAKSPFHATTEGTIDKGGYYIRSYSSPEHFGTHVDAPAHFGRGQATLDKLGADKLFVAAVIIDISAQCTTNADYELSAEDVQAWEKKNGAIAAGSAVLLRTGWGARVADMKKYRNADAKGVQHFPGFGLAAAKVLIDQRKAIAFGIDNLSIDPGRSQDFAVHAYDQAHGLYHMENLANLEKLPARVFLIVAPIKLENGSGGQARVWAVVD